MRIHGYCTECRRVKLVSVKTGDLARGMIQGVCSDCEESATLKRIAARAAPKQ